MFQSPGITDLLGEYGLMADAMGRANKNRLGVTAGIAEPAVPGALLSQQRLRYKVSLLTGEEPEKKNSC